MAIPKRSNGQLVQRRAAGDARPAKDGAKKRGFLATLGPGLITGAADDDPSGIATYSQVGAQFGLQTLWTLLFSYPLMIGVQEICGQIGRVTGKGIAGNLRGHYHPALLFSCVFLVLVANTINLGADIGAMGSALTLLVGGPTLAYSTGFAVIGAILQIWLPYERYAAILKGLCAALFAYVATVLVVHVPWLVALRATVLPSITPTVSYLTGIVAILGTTISPYMFFWQAGEEAELERATRAELPLKFAPNQAKAQLHRIRIDTYTGMAFSNIVSFFIILTAATTLHTHGVTDISTATQAAEALRPLAGKFAFLLFAMGIIGMGLLAVPVLAGSAAYAVGEALSWHVGLNMLPRRATEFYSVLAASTLIGLALNFFHVNPIKALFWSAVINGVVAVPILVMMMSISQNRDIMGRFTIERRNVILGWATTIVMAAAAIAMFATWGK